MGNASRCLRVFQAGLGLLGHREVLAGAQVMPWGSHIPEDTESPFSRRALGCHLSPGHTIPLTELLSSSLYPPGRAALVLLGQVSLQLL